MLDKAFAVFTVPILSAMIYIAGYSYLDGYYSYFSLSVSELSFSAQDVLIHFIPALSQAVKSAWFWLILTGMAAITAGTFRWKSERREEDVVNSVVSLMLSTALILILYIFLNASHFGRVVAREALATANPLILNDKPESEITAVLSMPDAMLFHLLTTESTIYAIVSIGERNEKWTVRIPRGDLTSVVYSD